MTTPELNVHVSFILNHLTGRAPFYLAVDDVRMIHDGAVNNRHTSLSYQVKACEFIRLNSLDSVTIDETSSPSANISSTILLCLTIDRTLIVFSCRITGTNMWNTRSTRTSVLPTCVPQRLGWR